MTGRADVGAVPDHALQLRSTVTESGNVELSLTEVEVPTPRPGQVLVRVEASPINPSDLGLLLAGADISQATVSGFSERSVLTAPLPSSAIRASAARVGLSLPVGNEGAGTVVASGSDPDARQLIGKVVAIAGGAMYSQYRMIDAAACMVLPDGASARDGAASFVNPLTAIGMVETMRAEGHRALVHTAAASNLGQMLQRYCLGQEVALVNIVRSKPQADILRAIGATYACDSSSDTFMPNLIEAVEATSATLAFDAVGGGELAARILTAMEVAASSGGPFSAYGSSVHKQVYIYGGLDRSPTMLTRSFGASWGIGGWLLTPFLQKAGAEKVQEMRRQVRVGLTSTFASHFTDSISLSQVLDPQVVVCYSLVATGQKFLVLPNA